MSLQFVNHAFQLVAYQGEVALTHFQFAQPVTLVLVYTDVQIQGLDERQLAFYFLDEESGTWRTDGITIVERDIDNNRLVVQITHLTSFALFGSTLTAVPTATPTIMPTSLPGPALYLPLIRRSNFKEKRSIGRAYCASRYCIEARD